MDKHVISEAFNMINVGIKKGKKSLKESKLNEAEAMSNKLTPATIQDMFDTWIQDMLSNDVDEILEIIYNELDVPENARKTVFTTERLCEAYEYLVDVILQTVSESVDFLKEAMSPEDQADSDVIMSVYDKTKNRSNAKLSPEENSVMDKYGLHRFSGWRNGARILNNKDDVVASEFDFPRRWDEKQRPVNFADRARKLNTTRGRGTFVDNIKDTIGSVDDDRYSADARDDLDDTFQDKWRMNMSNRMSKPVDDMKSALRDRKYYQSAINDIDNNYNSSVDRAKKKYKDEIQKAKKTRKDSKVFCNNGIKDSQKEIDKLLNRKPVKESYRRRIR